MPQGEDLDIELPPLMSGKEIIREIINHGAAPSTDPEGNAYSYELITKRNNTKIENESLLDCNVQNGEILYLTPKLVAGQRTCDL